MELEKYMDDANLETLGAEESTNEAESHGQAEESQPAEENSGTEGESSLESKLDDFKLEGEEGDHAQSGDLISGLNDLGILRNGLPVEFKDLEQVKELLSKGHDYTQKTQELSDSRKQFETETSELRKEIENERVALDKEKGEHQEQLHNYQTMVDTLVDLERNDPDLYAELSDAYDKHLRMRQAYSSNPALNQLNSEISQIKEMLGSKEQEGVQKQYEEIRTQWESGLTEAQAAYAPKLRSLGVRPNWEKVKGIWSADTTNEMSVKQALFAVHGEEIQKALDAQSKAAKTKQQSALRQGPDKIESEEAVSAKTHHGTGTYMSHLEKLATKYAS